MITKDVVWVATQRKLADGLLKEHADPAPEEPILTFTLSMIAANSVQMEPPPLSQEATIQYSVTERVHMVGQIYVMLLNEQMEIRLDKMVFYFQIYLELH